MINKTSIVLRASITVFFLTIVLLWGTNETLRRVSICFWSYLVLFAPWYFLIGNTLSNVDIVEQYVLSMIFSLLMITLSVMCMVLVHIPISAINIIVLAILISFLNIWYYYTYKKAE